MGRRINHKPPDGLEITGGMTRLFSSFFLFLKKLKITEEIYFYKGFQDFENYQKRAKVQDTGSNWGSR